MPQDPFVAQVILLGCNFAPTGYAFCQGQLMPLSQNTALFSLLGTTYGGDGASNFALPDLRGRVPIGAGQGPGLSDRSWGEMGGAETVAADETHLPAHAHDISIETPLTTSMRCTNGPANEGTPVGTTPASELAGTTTTYSNALADGTMSPDAIAIGGSIALSPSGGGQPHENRQPLLALNYCIALQGVFPPQS